MSGEWQRFNSQFAETEGERNHRLRETRLKGPLRKVVGGSVTDKGVQTDLLECGHEVHVRQDIYGATSPARRRCRHCKKEAEAP
jgi:hypothetical protein